jgi:hypothetical protein
MVEKVDIGKMWATMSGMPESRLACPRG